MNLEILIDEVRIHIRFPHLLHQILLLILLQNVTLNHELIVILLVLTDSNKNLSYIQEFRVVKSFLVGFEEHCTLLFEMEIIMLR